VAFLTLLERKVLRLRQIRIGPNKTYIFGLVQPLLDGVKLLVKPFYRIKHQIKIIYLISGVIRLVFNFILWFVVPYLSFDFSEYQFL
jgi:NADH-quinone oxidoreductase subunit H